MFTSCGGGNCSWLLESFILLANESIILFESNCDDFKSSDASHVHYSTEEIDLRRC